jgi:hypothetical protein
MVKIEMEKLETVQEALDILEAHYRGLEDAWVDAGEPIREVDSLLDASEVLGWIRELWSIKTTGKQICRSPFEYSRLEEVNLYLSKL